MNTKESKPTHRETANDDTVNDRNVPIEPDHTFKGNDTEWLHRQDDINSSIEEDIDLDDSVRDPDYVPTKKDLQYESSSEESNTATSINEHIDINEIVEHEEVIENRKTDDVEHGESPKKKKRKRKADKCCHQKNVQKRLRMQGKAYKGMTKDEGKWKYCMERSG